MDIKYKIAGNIKHKTCTKLFLTIPKTFINRTLGNFNTNNAGIRISELSLTKTLIVNKHKKRMFFCLKKANKAANIKTNCKGSS